MTGLLIIVGVTAVFGFILWLTDGRKRKKEEVSRPAATEEEETAPEENGESSECCGMHVVCEKTSLTPVASAEIIYYEDEELDRFSGRGAEDYGNEEIEEWRDVLLTLRPAEIAGWARSVQLRGLVMPSAIRDELLMIVSEARASLAGK